MREWLYLHGFIDTKPGVYVEELNKDELIKLAQTYKKYMLSDIQTWLADTEKDYQPWITKGNKERIKLMNGLMTHSLLVLTIGPKINCVNSWMSEKFHIPYSPLSIN